MWLSNETAGHASASEMMLDVTLNPEGHLQSPELICHIVFGRGKL